MKKHDEKYRQLGLNISHYRKIKGLTQEGLADITQHKQEEWHGK